MVQSGSAPEIGAVLCTLNCDVQTVDLVIPGYLGKVYLALLSLINSRLVEHDKGGWGVGCCHNVWDMKMSQK